MMRFRCRLGSHLMPEDSFDALLVPRNIDTTHDSIHDMQPTQTLCPTVIVHKHCAKASLPLSALLKKNGEVRKARLEFRTARLVHVFLIAIVRLCDCFEVLTSTEVSTAFLTAFLTAFADKVAVKFRMAWLALGECHGTIESGG